MFIPQPSDFDFEPAPSGSHVALCYRFLDLGTQLVEWQGTRKTQRKVLISWELPTEHMMDGKPFSVSRRYTWSMSPKASLRHDLEAWRGRAFTDADFRGAQRFNIKNVLGRACLVSVVRETKEGNVYANLAGVLAIPKGMAIPAGVNPTVYFSLEREFFDPAVLESLSDRLKETIKGSPEYAELMSGDDKPKQVENERIYGYEDEEIPF